MMLNAIKNGIYLGNRGPPFKKFIKGLLRKSSLKKRYIDMLTDEESMKVYSAAFTSELVDEKNNYQFYEQLGDTTGNKFIVWYMYRKFPQLKCTDGVKVVARLKINYGSKQSFSEIARELGFWKYISAPNELRQRKMKPLLEDVFESFLGATESILDDRIRIGVGYAIVYDILTKIFDAKDISLRYDDLYDAKTRLKELFDMYESKLGPLVYKDDKEGMLCSSTVYRVDGGSYEQRSNGTINKKRIIGGRYVKIGVGSSALKADARQAASANALNTLALQGWRKPVPRIYQMFSKDNGQVDVKVDRKHIVETWGDDINKLQFTKGKTKYQSKYASTPLALYCRKRNWEGIRTCLEMKADPNICDTDGMTPLDLLFIGKVDEDNLEKMMKLMVAGGSLLILKKEVFDMYYSQYRKEYFVGMVEHLKT